MVRRRTPRCYRRLLWRGRPRGRPPHLPLGCFLHVPCSRARIAVRGGRDTRLIATRTAARGRTLGTTTADPGGSGILELPAHAIDRSGVLRTESTALKGRRLTMTSTTTTHRRCIVSNFPERTFRVTERGRLRLAASGLSEA